MLPLSQNYAWRPTSWWNKVPAPQSPSDPVPVRSSKMEDISNKSGAYSILALAYNPSILEKGKENPAVRDQLIHLSLKYIEEHFRVVLSPCYSIEKFKLKGSLERMRQSLRGGQAPVPLSKQSTRQVTPSMKDSSVKDLMLNQLRNITAKEDSSDLSLLMENITPSKTRLIEEISSTTMPEESCTPVYALTTSKDEHGKPLNVELKVELPEIRCISECSLSVSKDDVLIECPEKYRLHLNLPQAVNEEATAATFYKRKGVLLITMPILQ
ncbi:PIH1 domain-containing protein 2 isoform X2 [Hemicordylus capensis]|uniref:PIH1 domain-containing protein 2 isoform X2 n=1 Tax=Hemicordylus capensis TaxID=884348 RepID=UPI002303A79E|nr:PIH1 domain-containing protein 2 isoform X2 [Hemicordylus capensis]